MTRAKAEPSLARLWPRQAPETLAHPRTRGHCSLYPRDKSWLRAARWTKINSSDPPLPAVCTAYATPPFLPFFHSPIELASSRPRGRLYLDRWIWLGQVRDPSASAMTSASVRGHGAERCDRAHQPSRRQQVLRLIALTNTTGTYGRGESVGGGHFSRQAASVCGVSHFLLRTSIRRGLLDDPPWTLEQFHAVRDAQDPGPRPQAPHGTTARWNDGCSCATCRDRKSVV